MVVIRLMFGVLLVVMWLHLLWWDEGTCVGVVLKWEAWWMEESQHIKDSLKATSGRRVCVGGGLTGPLHGDPPHWVVFYV